MRKGTDAAEWYGALARYGYPLLQPDRMADPNELLARLSQDEDPRRLEGFPVVLANALEKHRDLVDLAVAEKILPDAPARRRFRKLTALSFHLFGVFGLDALRRMGQARGMGPSQNTPPRLGRETPDLGRFKKTFLRYFVQRRETEVDERRARLREEFRREYFLSLFFAPRQRDLVQKKQRGEPLTKTEREYFSRVVKRKLTALADPDLHRLAQKALQ